MDISHVSICTNTKDTAKTCANVLYRSLIEAKSSRMISLHVCCWSNEAREILIEEVNKVKANYQGEYHPEIVLSNIPQEIRNRYYFNASAAINISVATAKDNILLCPGTDHILPKNIVELCNKYISDGRGWIPFAYCLHKGKLPVISGDNNRQNSGANGWWRMAGFAPFGITKHDWDMIGGCNEEFSEYGGSDNDLFVRMVDHDIKIFRNKCLGLFHTWHEQDKEWRKTKNKGWGKAISMTKQRRQLIETDLSDPSQ